MTCQARCICAELQKRRSNYTIQAQSPPHCNINIFLSCILLLQLLLQLMQLCHDAHVVQMVELWQGCAMYCLAAVYYVATNVTVEMPFFNVILMSGSWKTMRSMSKFEKRYTNLTQLQLRPRLCIDSFLL